MEATWATKHPTTRRTMRPSADPQRGAFRNAHCSGMSACTPGSELAPSTHLPHSHEQHHSAYPCRKASWMLSIRPCRRGSGSGSDTTFRLYGPELTGTVTGGNGADAAPRDGLGPVPA